MTCQAVDREVQSPFRQIIESCDSLLDLLPILLRALAALAVIIKTLEFDFNVITSRRNDSVNGLVPD